MKQLIVNADDFGLTEAVNAGIIQAHAEGIVTSTTIMATGAAFDAAVSASRHAPRLGVGVHLNLTEGPPLSPPRSIPTLVDANGRLHLNPGRLLRALAARQVSLTEIEAELRCQIAKVFAAGIRPTHLDGHKHMHLLPGVSEIVIRLAREFTIPSIRCPQECMPSLRMLRRRRNSRTEVVKQFLVARVVSAFAQRFTRQLAEAGLLRAAYFYGLSQTGFLQAQEVIDILTCLPDGVSELMCHPGYVDGDLVNSGTRLLTEREIEIQALTAPMVKRLVADQGIVLISYQQLEESNKKGVSDESCNEVFDCRTTL
jgi:hopanoid biosynthesis associated protein HpnK